MRKRNSTKSNLGSANEKVRYENGITKYSVRKHELPLFNRHTSANTHIYVYKFEKGKMHIVYFVPHTQQEKHTTKEDIQKNEARLKSNVLFVIYGEKTSSSSTSTSWLIWGGVFVFVWCVAKQKTEYGGRMGVVRDFMLTKANSDEFNICTYWGTHFFFRSIETVLSCYMHYSF